MSRRRIPVEAFLANLPLFRQLEHADVARLAAGATEIAARRGAVLVRAAGSTTSITIATPPIHTTTAIT